jgi:hypothetical protein
VATPGFPELEVLVQAIRAADSLDEALGTLADALNRAGFETAHCGLATLGPDQAFHVLGLWSALPTIFEPGALISTLGTETMGEQAQELRKGKAVRVSMSSQDHGLLGDLLQNEGAPAWLAAPIDMPGPSLAVLAVSSANRQGFDRVDLDRFQRLVTEVGPTMLSKAHPPFDTSDS